MRNYKNFALIKKFWDIKILRLNKFQNFKSKEI